jgi:hypothetical protein
MRRGRLRAMNKERILKSNLRLRQTRNNKDRIKREA